MENIKIENSVLDRDRIHNINDEEYETVYVEEWGGNVRIYVMNGKERLDIEEKFIDGGNRKLESFLYLLALCLKDESGNRIFLDNEIDKLGQKSSKVTAMLINKCLELNGLSQSSREDIKKN